MPSWAGQLSSPPSGSRWRVAAAAMTRAAEEVAEAQMAQIVLKVEVVAVEVVAP